MENCGRNQEKVLIGAAYWWEESVVGGWRGGEGVWSYSMYRSLKNMGYTVLMTHTLDETLRMYRQMPDLIRVVIRDYHDDMNRPDYFFKTENNPTGIPVWKFFEMKFWPGRGSGPLSRQWTITAERPAFEELPLEEQFIGYAIEDECATSPFVPFAQRPDRAYLYAKQLSYAYTPSFAWNRTWFETLVRDISGLEIVGGFDLDEHYQWDPEVDGHFEDIPGGLRAVTNLGKIGNERFLEELSQSKVFLGIGNPLDGPSAYYALCMGIPYINPIIQWSHDEPDNKQHWHSQHNKLKEFDPPFVYNVHSHDYDKLVTALKSAMTHPIPKTILPYMKQKAHEERMQALMETDWKSLCEIELDQRKADGQSLPYAL